MKDKFHLVGTKIPEFRLPNSRGETKSISDFLGKNVVIILLRGIIWPHCKAHIVRLAGSYEKFQELNAELYPITVDKLENAQKLETKYARGKYPIYYDEDKKVAKLLHQEWKILKLGRMPGMLIVDKEGVIQWAYYSNSMSDIPKNEVVLEVLEKLPHWFGKRKIEKYMTFSSKTSPKVHQITFFS